jgi:hypothetical protein
MTSLFVINQETPEERSRRVAPQILGLAAHTTDHFYYVLYYTNITKFMAVEFQNATKIIQNPTFEHDFDTVCTSPTFAIGYPTVTFRFKLALPDGLIIRIATLQNFAHSLSFPT